MKSSTISVNNKDLPIDKESTSLLDFLIKKKVDINHSCGGFGTCGTCRVFVKNYEILESRESIEQEMADDRGFLPSERLACQNHVIAGLVIEIPS